VKVNNLRPNPSPLSPLPRYNYTQTLLARRRSDRQTHQSGRARVREARGDQSNGGRHVRGVERGPKTVPLAGAMVIGFGLKRGCDPEGSGLSSLTFNID